MPLSKPLPGSLWRPRGGIPQPVGAWLLNDGGAQARDSSGNRNHGTLTNMDPATDWVGTPYGGGLNFDGSNDRIALPDIPGLATPGTVIFGGMIPGALAQFAVSRNGLGGNNGWGFGVNSSNQPYWFAGGQGTFSWETLTVPTGVPIWMGYTYPNSPNRTVTVRGPGYAATETKSASYWGNAGGMLHHIGAYNVTYWSGDLYAVLMWDVALTVAALADVLDNPFAGWRPSQQCWYAAAGGAEQAAANMVRSVMVIG